MSGSSSGRRADHRLATDLALRRAAFILFAERGYAATSTDDIARAAGVSPRTFFNYFAAKEALFFLPEQPLAGVLAASIGARPAGEDPVRSVTVASIELFRLIETVIATDRDLGLTSLRLMLTDPDCRPFLERRRDLAERTMWQSLVSRGVSPADLSCRAIVAAVVAAGWVALAAWVECDGLESLGALLARCLLGLPEPARLAAGVLGEASGS